MKDGSFLVTLRKTREEDGHCHCLSPPARQLGRSAVDLPFIAASFFASISPRGNPVFAE
jgi:hypothetical protein